ncbi:MAG: Maf family protein [Phycisphaerae bacterium]|jgi:septum formation protein
MEKAFHLILASASPRRRQLLAAAGVPFEVIVPNIPEPDDVMNHLPPGQQAESLAYFKAREVWDQHPTRWVLGADTIVALGNQVLGKPRDEAHARQMLSLLSGSRHAVITGVTLLGPLGRRLIASDVTYITMKKMSPADIDAYIASREWVGKAGAYAIQETADRYIEKVDGSFTNVVGLPMELLMRMIDEVRQS